MNRLLRRGATIERLRDRVSEIRLSKGPRRFTFITRNKDLRTVTVDSTLVQTENVIVGLLDTLHGRQPSRFVRRLSFDLSTLPVRPINASRLALQAVTLDLEVAFWL